MTYPIPVPQEVEALLTKATSQQLAYLGMCVITAEVEGVIPAEAAGLIHSVLQYELGLRQIEPLYRKTIRLARRAKDTFADWWQRNGEGATKVAAGVALGLLFGVVLDD